MNWRCLIGRHDWDEYGECRRNWQHVQGMYDPAVWLSYGGPWSRVARLRRAAKVRAGEALQAELAELGEQVTLEMCMEVARDPRLTASVLEIARERRARRSLATRE